jgi:hypothetical protein
MKPYDRLLWLNDDNKSCAALIKMLPQPSGRSLLKGKARDAGALAGLFDGYDRLKSSRPTT